MEGSRGIHPQHLGTPFFRQGLSLFQRKQEQRRGQSVSQAGILTHDGDGSPQRTGHKGIRVDDMVVGLALHQEIALVVAAGDHCGIGIIYGVQVFPAVGVIDAHHPGSAGFILGAGGADIAAHADDHAFRRPLRHLLHRPALCHRAHIQRFKGRSDDMLIIKGVNVFPSQVEAALLNIDGVTPNYFMTVDRVDNSDTLEVAVEVEDRFFSDDMAELERLSQKVKAQLKSAIGLNAKIKLVEPNGLEHSQGKTVHVLDKRKLYD